MPAKVYLRNFELASGNREMKFILDQKMTCFNGIYPFKIFPDKELSRLEFKPITIFYGGNGDRQNNFIEHHCRKNK